MRAGERRTRNLRALFGEGVVSSYSVIATGRVSRHRSEFATSNHSSDLRGSKLLANRL